MTKLIAVLALLFAAAAPAPEIIAKPVPFAPSHVETHFRGPLWDKGPGHRGIDIAINSSSPILAPFDGSVFFAGEVVDRQVVTLISESGLKASFEPVCGLQPVGTRVSKWQTIGVLCVPETDYEIHCVSCLHFSLRNNYGYLNPLLFYGGLKPPGLTR
jgi:hypothetical protein